MDDATTCSLSAPSVEAGSGLEHGVTEVKADRQFSYSKLAKAHERFTTPPLQSARHMLPTPPPNIAFPDGPPRCEQHDYLCHLEQIYHANCKRAEVDQQRQTPPPLLPQVKRETELLRTPPPSNSELPQSLFPASSGPLPASGMAPAARASPATRNSRRRWIPLSRLIPAGTIVLENYEILDESSLPPPLEGDGWTQLLKTSLRMAQSTSAMEANDVASDKKPAEGVPLEIEGAANHSPIRKKRKRGNTTFVAGRARKRLKSNAGVPTATPAVDSFLPSLLHCQDALILRCTYKQLDANSIALRVYLVPDDLEELDDDDFALGKRVRPADSTVLRVFASTVLDPELWQGHRTTMPPRSLLDEDDHRSILELYRAISSPDDDPAFVEGLHASEKVKDQIASAFIEDSESMLTELYPYQRASLAKMLQRELAPQWTVDPSYLRCTSAIDGSSFWLSVDGQVAVEPPEVLEPPSGILAEDMGAGKTAICIALVLSTLRELPVLVGTTTYQDGTGGPAPVLMTHQSRMFPFEKEIQIERELLPRVPPPILPEAEMEQREWESYLAQLEQQTRTDAQRTTPPLPSFRSLMIDYCRQTSGIAYEREAMPPGLFDELESCVPYYHLFPSPAQLATRSGRNGSVQATRIVVSAATLIVVPTDLVRQWQDELQKHVNPASGLRVLVLRTKHDAFRTAYELANYDLVLMSVARFSDAADEQNASPLLQVHWRRLIVDEGHTLSSANRLRDLAEQLRCQSRWAISGTPTTNLRSAMASNEGALFAHDATAGGSEKDFQRLAQLYSRFLRHPAVPKPEDFRRMFADPIIKTGRGAARLARMMDGCIVRNAAERVRLAYELPPLTKSVVEIAMNEAERKTYNALVAIFASNSITSQRKDEDYLFHPRQRKYLDELTTNLAASSFFFASHKTEQWLRHSVENSREYFDSETKTRSWSERDRLGLEKAVDVMQEALDDPEWRAIVNSTTINIDVEHLDDEVLRAFGGLSASRSQTDRSLMPLGSLVTLLRDLKELRRPEMAKWTDSDDLQEELITYEMKRQRDEATPATKQSAAEAASDAPKPRKRKKGEPEMFLPFPADSSFTRVTLGLTTSAKLNYVISQLRAYPMDKFIIFASALPDLHFATLSEALDLLQIKHVIYASHGKNRDRGGIAATFNSTTAIECQCILVDARLGGRGICLTAASRVIMLEPIWQPDLEVQAAKRAHRLGQTKPVDLQILVVPGSYEHSLLQRRAQLDPTDFSRTKVPQRDSQLSAVLQSAQYLEPSPTCARPMYSRTLLMDDSNRLPSPSLISTKSRATLSSSVSSPKKQAGRRVANGTGLLSQKATGSASPVTKKCVSFATL